jgi:thiamine-phosphate pyrophosphorylase
VTTKLYRLLDANLNRVREGIRVVEDIARFHDENREISSKLKELRHSCRIESDQLLINRDIINDILKDTTDSELKRDNIESVIVANMKRAQESSRVLEEVLKIFDLSESKKFKHIRYELYDIEKRSMGLAY